VLNSRRNQKYMAQDLTIKLDEATNWLKSEYAGIRTGQASPGLFDGIKVENYGSMMPLNQMSNIGIEDARTLRISPWDTAQIPAIEKALSEADLGISVATDSAGLRAVFPELTAERREQLQKLAKSKLEEARIRVRSARDEEMKNIDKQHKDGDISEDEKFTQKETVQTKVDTTNEKLEALFQQKESELAT
jgi:ribosome recycling factor